MTQLVAKTLPESLIPLVDELTTHITDAFETAKTTTGRSRFGVAYSGGVDSATLAALVAHAIGGANTLLLLAVSASLARRDLEFARRQAQQLGITLVEFKTSELDDANYISNPADRCYFCKSELFTQIDQQLVDRWDIAVVAYGENADDTVRPDRPGSQAAREHQVLYPLGEVGVTKSKVRELADAWGLLAATKPQAPCLASRIPHGQEVSASKLKQIDRAEDSVLELGFSDCRVRHHGSIARIEVPTDEFDLLLDPKRRNLLVAKVRRAGFMHVTLDLNGIQSGLLTLSVLGGNHE